MELACALSYSGLQIVQLTASRKFEEALALCKLLPPEDAALRANKEDDIHRRLAVMIFLC